jgi:hypothetical protein
MRLIPIRLRPLLSLALGIAAAALAIPAPPAIASGAQASVFEDDVQMLNNPGGTLQELRHLGVGVVRLGVHWSSIAPSPSSRSKPRFNASDPNAYPAANWSHYDTIVRDAASDGIQIMFVPTAFAPLWAQGANPGKYGAKYDVEFAFMPSARGYGQFVHALGTRYSGHFKPRGSKSALPGVHIWELYNEANFGEDLAPQAINGSHVLYAPVMYRGLVSAGWGALHGTGHGRDTILIGALAARGAVVPSSRSTGLPGAYGETPPLQFIRELYCLDSSYRQYRGAAAAVRKCPTTAAASRRFRAQNPALFSSSGWSIHPYPLTNDANVPPTQTRYHNPNYVAFSQIPNMAKTLDRIQRGYGSGKRFPIWNTEYGYITNPPNASRTNPNVSLANQAYYDNWAEYLSWRNPRIVSAMQYLLVDPNPSVGVPQCGGFASGLIFYSTPPVTSGCSHYTPNTAKPGYNAYRLPLYLPSSATRAGQPLTVWGCVRPARYALLDVHTPQVAAIQFQRGSRGAWATVATVRTSVASCYFNTAVRFPASGSVRLAWSYPTNDPLLEPPTSGGYADPLGPALSRTVTIKIS